MQKLTLRSLSTPIYSAGNNGGGARLMIVSNKSNTAFQTLSLADPDNTVVASVLLPPMSQLLVKKDKAQKFVDADSSSNLFITYVS